MNIPLITPTSDEIAAAKRLIEAFEPKKYGRMYYQPAEDGDDEFDRQRDIKVVDDIRREAAE